MPCEAMIRASPGKTPLHFAAESYAGDGASVVKLLAERGADVNAKDNVRCAPLRRRQRARGGAPRHTAMLLIALL